MKRKVFLSAAFLIATLTIASCELHITVSDEISSEESVAIEGIAISSANDVRSIQVEQTLQLTAKVYPTNAVQDVTWSTSDSSIATVDSNGLVTGVAAGNVNIIATSTADSTISQTFALIIEEKVPEVILPESISLTSTGNVTTFKAGETLELTAVVYPVEASQSVTWNSSDETIAKVSRGVVTGLKEGVVTITVTAKDLSTVVASIELTIEKADNPVLTKDWPNMNYTTHEQFIDGENDTPMKVKGVVTHINNIDDGEVSYYLQNGDEGYYVYAQNAISFPVELGKVYEVGGFKKYYFAGIHELVDVEYFNLLSEELTYSITTLNDKDPTSKEEMKAHFYSYVSGDAIIKSIPSIGTKAYTVDVTVNGKDIALRVDPSAMSDEEFASIASSFATAVEGSTLSFKGILTQYGYGTPKNQIEIVKASDLKFAEVTDATIVSAAIDALSLLGTIQKNVNTITLPSTIDGFDGVNVTWTSNSELINVETGEVKHNEDDTVVTLTATVTLNNDSLTKEFNLNVYGTKSYTVVASLDLEDADREGSYGNSNTKPSYAEANVVLGGHTWMLRNALIAATANDKVDGFMAIRIQSNNDASSTGRVEIIEAGEYNYVQFDACVYGNDTAGIQLGIAYTDENGNWVDSGTIITLDNRTLETFRVSLPEGNKRVAIYVVAGSGRRANLDNIKLMK